MEPIIDGSIPTRVMEFGAEGLFYLITLIFLFFSLSIAYHWLAYGTNRSQSVLFLVIFIMVSMLFFIGMTVSLNTFQF
tara:strand:- start:560 stop:793 length:234 start_codon:yes stop_codon:yes gene_type:complete